MGWQYIPVRLESNVSREKPAKDQLSQIRDTGADGLILVRFAAIPQQRLSEQLKQGSAMS